MKALGMLCVENQSIPPEVCLEAPRYINQVSRKSHHSPRPPTQSPHVPSAEVNVTVFIRSSVMFPSANNVVAARERLGAAGVPHTRITRLYLPAGA
eukprot:1753122-Rhodomonas_salina.1